MSCVSRWVSGSWKVSLGRVWIVVFLILPDKHLAHVPGTILLDGQSANREAYLGNLKHGTGRYAHIVLAPQPSENPNDPLNWPMWKKEMIFLILNFGAMLYVSTNVDPRSIRVPINFLLGTFTELLIGRHCERCGSFYQRRCNYWWLQSFNCRLLRV